MSQSDYTGVGHSALSLIRSYRSSRVIADLEGYTGPANQTTVTVTEKGIGTDRRGFNPGMGQPWSHNHAHYLALTGTLGVQGSTAKLMLGDGSVRAFTFSGGEGGTFQPHNSVDTLSINPAGLAYYRQDDNSTWQFNLAGQLQTITQKNGWITTYRYSTTQTPASIAPVTDLLISVTHPLGSVMAFDYNANSQLSRVVTPDGQTLSYSYDSTLVTGRLTNVTYPDGTSKTYVYGNAAFPHLLTDIRDEAGNLYETVTYDSAGRGISTELAGGANKYRIAYGENEQVPTVVTDPLGTQRSYHYGTTYNKLVVTGASRPSGRGSDAASRVQDTNGLVSQENDFLGVQTLYTWDASRRLPLTTTQAAGLPEVQTTQTQWHPTFRLPVLITEAGKTTAYTYDNQRNKLSEVITDIATG